MDLERSLPLDGAGAGVGVFALPVTQRAGKAPPAPFRLSRALTPIPDPSPIEGGKEVTGYSPGPRGRIRDRAVSLNGRWYKMASLRAREGSRVPHSIEGSTLSGGLWPSWKALMLMITLSPISARPSIVAEPRWGSSTTLGIFNRRGSTLGSFS